MSAFSRRAVLYWGSEEAPNVLPLLDAGWQVHAAHDAAQAASLARARRYRVGVAVFDPGATALSLVQELVLGVPDMEWIALVANGSPWTGEAKRVIADSFFDYHTLPVDAARLSLSLGHAYGVAELRRASGAQGEGARGQFAMVGRSAAMRSLYQAIRRISASEAPVLITGETGTGKELAARALHEGSTRRNAPFVAVNCGALPETLIQAELFGHERGAFTDARERKLGRIEMAAGGTLFLDEIGDLPLSVQTVLLRFLQEGTIERLGGRSTTRVDVRVIAATHVDLERSIAEARFREDLYYRLNVLRLRVPPLREREGDVELLAQAMFERFAQRAGKRIRGFSRAAMDRMVAHPWPGNVRELVNRVQRGVVMCEGRLIAPADLGLERRAASRTLGTLEQSREQAEQNAIRDALIRNRSVIRASAALGISRMTLYRRMAKYGLKPKDLPHA